MRNIINHNGMMYVHSSMVMKINENMYFLGITRYPWLKNLPSNWSMILQFFEVYTYSIDFTNVKWRILTEGSYKYNSNGAYKDTLGLRENAFCISGDIGLYIYTKTNVCGSVAILEDKTFALRWGLE